MEKKKYSAEEAAKILKSEGYDISKRTVNYYAFDKKLFEVKETGKNCFTDEELDKIRGIRILQEYTNYTLNQIKEIINRYTLSEITKMCEGRLQSISYNYGGNYITESICRTDSRTSSAGTPNPVQGHSITPLHKNAVVSLPRPIEEPDSKISSGTRTIKINDDITLIVSSAYDSEKLKKLIDFINKNE